MTQTKFPPRTIDEQLTDDLEQADYLRQLRHPMDQVCPPDPPLWLAVLSLAVVALIGAIVLRGLGWAP